MSIHRKIDNLYIRLMGDFDGSSAWELINAVSENLNKSKLIQIDTSKLKKVYPFGREVFKSNFLSVKDARIRIQFSGPNALRIAPHYTTQSENNSFRGDALIRGKKGLKNENKCREKR